jgi:hypothetical protein
MKATHINIEKFDTNRKLANRALKAMSDILDYDCGTIRNPYELASSILEDGRTLIQTIYEDGEVDYADGYFVVEVDHDFMYVDITGKYLRECVVDEYEYQYTEDFEDQEWIEEGDFAPYTKITKIKS